MELQVHICLDIQLEKSDFSFFLVSLRSAFSQGFFISYDKFLTSEKFLRSGMKWETFEPDSPKGGKSW